MRSLCGYAIAFFGEMHYNVYNYVNREGGGCGAAGGCGGAAGAAACQQAQRSGTAASGSNVAQEAAARDLALHLVTSFLLLHRSCVGPALLLQV